jgi:trk system potassium uptake protein TrkA
MFLVIVGAGRVGSTVAKRMLTAGNDVSVLDEDPLSLEKLEVGMPAGWEDSGGRFTLGTALEVEALIAAGIEEADVLICATNGDNTNLVVAQIAQKRFNVAKVIVRVLDPGRAEWYGRQGLHTICPTQQAIEMLEQVVLAP